MINCVPENDSKVASTGPASVRLRSRPMAKVPLVACSAVTKLLPGPVIVPSMATTPATGTGGGGSHFVACSSATVPLSVSARFGESSTR